MPLADAELTSPADLLPSELPAARGPLTEWLFARLPRPPHDLGPAPGFTDALYGEDAALALYALYELHYRGFAGVADEWEWEPALLGVRRELEADLLARLRATCPPPDGAGPVGGALRELASAPGGPSLSRFLAEEGTAEQFREYAVHRSAYQLKEADPHTWGIPRVTGPVKAAMVEIQADEYGAGREADMHQNLFARTMRALGLDSGYNRYLDLLPATTLAPVNVVSFFGLHRRWRGALVGHLALFEMTSVQPMASYRAALDRLGYGPAAKQFFDVHVVADAHHETVAAEQLAGGLARQDPALAADILFGAHALDAVERSWAAALLGAWRAGSSSLLAPLPVLAGR